jgi:hypothetical protein
VGEGHRIQTGRGITAASPPEAPSLAGSGGAHEASRVSRAAEEGLAFLLPQPDLALDRRSGARVRPRRRQSPGEVR